MLFITLEKVVLIQKVVLSFVKFGQCWKKGIVDSVSNLKLKIKVRVFIKLFIELWSRKELDSQINVVRYLIPLLLRFWEGLMDRRIYNSWKRSIFEGFIARILLHSVFSWNLGKYGPEKLHIQTFFKQWPFFKNFLRITYRHIEVIV